MSNLPKVRVGTLEDLDAMMAIAMAATEENAALPPDPARLLEDMYAALSLHHGIVGIVGEPGEQIEGAVLLRVGTLWYSAVPALEEKAVYVHPDFRAVKGSRAKALMEFAKKASDDLGMPLIIGVLSSERTEAKMRLYERQFGAPAGAFFIYGTTTGSHESPTH